ncbi:MAG: hypothetical protein K6U87_14515 [Firmicutes bacterium]|nr:hypothetical protein [Bacillota bacterium]
MSGSWNRRQVAAVLAAIALIVATAAAWVGTPLRAATTISVASSSGGVTISPAMFGVNVGTWEQQLLDPSTISTLRHLRLGMQRFPNPGGIYNWMSNQALSPTGQWNPQPVSLDRWGKILEASGMQGLYIVPYGFDPTGKAGEPISDVQNLTRYIVAHHIPVTAMEIGSEEYLGGTINLHQQKTPQRYAQLAAQMAQAIHAIDPAMQVGVDFDLPENPTQPDANALAWNQAVLSADAPYVQFVSVHAYPLPVVQDDPHLLQSLHDYIRDDMRFIRDQLHQFGGPDASHLGVWITEYNPYNGASAQSLQPIFAAAATESLLLWTQYGADKVFWWSLHGDAKAPVPTGQAVSSTYLVTDPHASFGTFGLASEAIAPQPQPVNRLYPAGQAIAQLLQAIGSQAALEYVSVLYSQYHLLGFTLERPQGPLAVLINARSEAQTVTLGDQTWTLSPGQMVMTAGSAEQATVDGGSPVAPTPGLDTATWDVTSGVLEVQGSGFGSEPPVRAAPSGGVDQAALEVLDQTSGASYGWSMGDHTDWYGIKILSWSPNDIRVQFATAPPSATDALTVRWWKPVAGQPLLQAEALVNAQWLGGANSPPAVSKISWQGPLTLVIQGNNFGPMPSTIPAGGGGVDQGILAIYDQKTKATYGWAQGGTVDYYGLKISQWDPTQITVQFVATPPSAGDPLQIRFPGLTAQGWTTAVPPA